MITRFIKLTIVSALILTVAINGMPAQAAKDKTELYAVIVGISKYKSKDIPELTMSDKDARDFHAFLKERAGLFSKAHIHPPLLNENATRANVVKALRDHLKPAGKDDIVIIYLSGHGAADPKAMDEFYFVTYDADFENLFGTALLMNDQNLFKSVDSEKVLLIADACHSGGFADGIQKATAKSAQKFSGVFQSLEGRIGLLSSKPEQLSYEEPRYGNSIFTHYLLKGFRGEAFAGAKDGAITAKDIYNYVYTNTNQVTKGLQQPQLYASKGRATDVPVFKTSTFQQPLNINVNFFYEDDQGKISPLENWHVLRSGQKVGLSFQAETDCYAYIFWKDSNNNMGMLFPNEKLTDGTAKIVQGKQYWLPSKGGDRWYVLDDNPGEEVIYFVASREKNANIEELFKSLSRSQMAGAKQLAVQNTQKLEREMSLMGAPIRTMGFRQETVAKVDQQQGSQGAGNSTGLNAYPAQAAASMPVTIVSFEDSASLVSSFDSKIQVSGADAVFKLEFKHIGK